MKSVVELLQTKQDFMYFKVNDAIRSIKNAQKQLSLVFSNDYKEYLKYYGNGVYKGHELTGIDDYEANNVVYITELEKSFNPNIPNDWYVIEESGYNNNVIWQNKDGEIFITYPDGTYEKLYDNLYDYIDKYDIKCN